MQTVLQQAASSQPGTGRDWWHAPPVPQLGIPQSAPQTVAEIVIQESSQATSQQYGSSSQTHDSRIGSEHPGAPTTQAS